MGTLEKVVAALYATTMYPPDKVHQPWVAHNEAQAASGLRWLNDLPDGKWLAGERMSQADITTAVMLDFTRIARLAGDLVSVFSQLCSSRTKRACAALSRYSISCLLIRSKNNSYSRHESRNIAHRTIPTCREIPPRRNLPTRAIPSPVAPFQLASGVPGADASAPSFFRASWSAPRKPSMANVPRKLPALHRFSKITPLGNLETQSPDGQEIGSCFHPFPDRSCPAFGQFQNPPAGRPL